MFGVLNTLLFFQAALLPVGFPGWMQAVANRSIYPHRACLEGLMPKNGLEAISFDLLYLAVFTATTMSSRTLLFDEL
jgi:hypothetical protein